jgi:hypothetical protein
VHKDFFVKATRQRVRPTHPEMSVQGLGVQSRADVFAPSGAEAGTALGSAARCSRFSRQIQPSDSHRHPRHLGPDPFWGGMANLAC